MQYIVYAVLAALVAASEGLGLSSSVPHNSITQVIVAGLSAALRAARPTPAPAPPAVAEIKVPLDPAAAMPPVS